MKETIPLTLIFDPETAAHTDGNCAGVSLANVEGKITHHLTSGQKYKITHAQPVPARYNGKDCQIYCIEGELAVNHRTSRKDGIKQEIFECELLSATVTYSIDGLQNSTGVPSYILTTVFSDSEILEIT